MSKLSRLFHMERGVTGRASVLQTPLNKTQRDVLLPAITDLAIVTGNTKSGVVLQFLRDGAIGADGYEASCIEGVYIDTQHREDADPYPRKHGVIRGVEVYIDNLLGHTSSRSVFVCEKADYLLKPMLQYFADLAKRENLRVHEPIVVDDPRVNLEVYYAKHFFEFIEANGGFVLPDARQAVLREGTPSVLPLIEVALSNWSVVREMGDFVLKYFVYVVAATENMDDCVRDRLEFADVCREAYRNRMRIEKAEEARRANLESPAPCIRYDLKNGDYVAVSGEYQAVNPCDANSCSYAGVIQVRHADQQRIPSFIFFSDKCIDALSAEEKEDFIAQADDIWFNGSLAAIKNAEIEIIVDDEGHPTNLEQYLSQQRVMIYPVEESGLYKAGGSPVEGMIVRNAE